MTRPELAEALAVKANIPCRRAEEIINGIFEAMTEVLVDGGRVEIRGFGSLVARAYGSYTGRNPKTGEPITVKPKKLPFFKAGKEIKERVLES